MARDLDDELRLAKTGLHDALAALGRVHQESVDRMKAARERVTEAKRRVEVAEKRIASPDQEIA
jgi:hypothetical protein